MRIVCPGRGEQDGVREIIRRPLDAPSNQISSQLNIHIIRCSACELKSGRLSLWPALKGGDGEEGEHAIQHVVKVEVAVEPLSLGQRRVLEGILHVLPEETPVRRHGRGRVSLGQFGGLAQARMVTRWAPALLLAFRLGHFGRVRAAVEFTLDEKNQRLVQRLASAHPEVTRTFGTESPHLEELHSDAGEHEVEQHGDQDNVTNGFDGHEHALDHVLLNTKSDSKGAVHGKLGCCINGI